jgi:hypothetical protein
MTRKTQLIIASSILASALGFILINRSRKKKQIEEIFKIIDEGVGEAGDLTDLTGGLNTEDIKRVNADPNAKERAKKAAIKIVNAKGYGGWANDDEDAVYDALGSLNSQAEVKLVSNIIMGMKGKSLMTWLGFLDSDEMAKVNTIIAKLK